MVRNRSWPAVSQILSWSWLTGTSLACVQASGCNDGSNWGWSSCGKGYNLLANMVQHPSVASTLHQGSPKLRDPEFKGGHLLHPFRAMSEIWTKKPKPKGQKVGSGPVREGCWFNYIGLSRFPLKSALPCFAVNQSGRTMYQGPPSKSQTPNYIGP